MGQRGSARWGFRGRLFPPAFPRDGANRHSCSGRVCCVAVGSVALMPHDWTLDPMAVAHALGQANDHADGWRAADFVGVASSIVDGLHYNVDLQARIPVGEGSLGYGNGRVELAHARWAATDSIAAIDLCAAVLGRLLTDRFPRPGTGREMDFVDAHDRLGDHPGASPWMVAVAKDGDYELVNAFRQAAVHRLIHRHVVVGGTTDGTVRTSWSAGLNGPQEEVRALPVLARDVATRHVEAFLVAVDRGDFSTL